MEENEFLEYCEVIMTSCERQKVRSRLGPAMMQLCYAQGISTYNMIDWFKEMDFMLQIEGREKGEYPFDKRVGVSVGDRVIKIANHPLEDMPAGSKGIIVGSVVIPGSGQHVVMVWWEGTAKDLINNLSREKIEVL